MEERERTLAREKSYLQLVCHLMNELSEVPGLEHTVHGLLELLLRNLGGVSVSLYYWVGSRIRFADVYGGWSTPETIEDPLVRAALERGDLVEEARDFAETGMQTAAFCRASSWAMPLRVGEQVVGVLKTEGMLLSASGLRAELRPFFNYAALVLKNEVESHQQHLETAQLAAIVQSSEDAIIGKTLEGVITSWNRGAERMYGFGAAEAIGRSIEMLVPVGRERELREALARLREGRRVERLETLRRRKDGQEIHVSLTLSPVKDANGRLTGISTIARDVTDQIRTEEELRRLNRALRILGDCGQALRHAADEEALLREVCRITVEVGGYRLAWVGYAENDEAKSVRLVAWAGCPSEYADSARVSWGENAHGGGPGGRAIRTGEVCLARDIASDPTFEPWRERALRSGCRSVVALPLQGDGNAFGALGVYAAEADAFDDAELATLKKLSAELAFGIAALRAQAAQVEAEARLHWFRQLVNQSNDAIYVIDAPTGRVMDTNDTACRALGLQREELLGRSVADFDPAMADASAWPQHVREMRSAGSRTLESTHRRKDGTTFPVEVSVRRVVLAREEYLIAVARDITERKQAEEALAHHRGHLEELVAERTRQLRESEEHFRRLYEMTLQGVVCHNADGSVVSVNPAAERILGIGSPAVGTRSLWDGEDRVIREDGSVLSWQDHPAMVALRSGVPTRDLTLGVRNLVEQRYRWILVHAVPLFRPGETLPYRAYVLFDDVTERRQAEAEIRRLNQDLKDRATALEAANRELEAFSYSVSHDLRAPLRAIDGFSQALVEDYGAALTEEGRDYLGRVRHAAQRMSQLIDDLLSLARVTRGELRLGRVDLSALARDIVAEFARAEPHRQVRFTLTPGMEAMGDARFLRLALENLLGNAWKFTARRAEAEVEFGVTHEDNAAVYFVRDNGAGFDMRYAERLFRPFQRLHSTEEFLGSGVGLATVQRILHRHGGRVWAEGRVDRGATFSFTLP